MGTFFSEKICVDVRENLNNDYIAVINMIKN